MGQCLFFRKRHPVSQTGLEFEQAIVKASGLAGGAIPKILAAKEYFDR
jgi:hypothetical protein